MQRDDYDATITTLYLEGLDVSHCFGELKKARAGYVCSDFKVVERPSCDFSLESW